MWLEAQYKPTLGQDLLILRLRAHASPFPPPPPTVEEIVVGTHGIYKTCFESKGLLWETFIRALSTDLSSIAISSLISNIVYGRYNDLYFYTKLDLSC